MKKINLLVIIILIFMLDTVSFALNSCDLDHRDGGGNGGCHSQGSTCSHSKGSGYWDYTCEHSSSSSSGYHARNCTSSSCSKNRPKSSTANHNSNGSCPNCGASSKRCTTCDHIKYHSCHTCSYNASTTYPTCTSGGYTYYWCSCGANYTSDYTSALGHAAGAAATCTAAQKCTRCGTTLANALGHNPGSAATCTTAQKCTRCGTTLANALGHNPGSAATCTTAQKCTRCSATITNALGHNPGSAATCTTAQKCTRCSATITNALGHAAGAAATCTTAQKCTRCGTTLANALGHNPGSAATCTTAQKCTRCGTTLANALGHNPGSVATCTTAQKCTRCNATLVNALGHAAGAAATCTTTQTCTRCGVKLADALGHNPGAAATCTTAQKCTRCGTTLANALGHNPGVAATCTVAQTCTRCGVVLANALGHDPGAAATCTTSQKCKRCNATLVNALGHAAGAAATCTTSQKCTRCGIVLANALGHDYSGAWLYGSGNQTTSNQHWKKCSRCTATDHYGYHADSSTVDGKCDTCGCNLDHTSPTITSLTIDNTSYQKSHIATLNVNDTGNSKLKAGNYTVRYSWTTSTSTPSSYESTVTLTVGSNTNTASVNISGSGYTGVYYLHVKVEGLVDNAGNALTTNTKYVSANFDNTAPTISSLVIGKASYEKSQTATLSVQDTGGSFLKAGNYTVRYSWTTSTSTPSSYASTTTLTVGANANTASVNISGSGYTGTYYLHVLVEGLVDNAGNALTANTKYASANFDNTEPTISSLVIDKASYEKSHTATLSVQDTGGSNLKAGNYTVRYSWTTSTSTPSSYASTTTLTVGANANTASVNISGSGYTGVYYLHVKVEGLVDNAGNALSANTKYVSANFDNQLPIISGLAIDKNSYEKLHTATLNVQDTGGSYLKAGSYTVRYSWTTSTATPSAYVSTTTLTVGSNTNTASVNITGSGYTGVYYLHVKVEGLVDNAGNALTANTKYVSANFDNTAPTITGLTISDSSTYKKSHTATLSVQDTGGSYLKAGNYTVRYSWTTTTATPSSYASTATLTVGANANKASVNITGSGYTGTYYLHVKVEGLVDNAGNALTANTKYVSANFDNTVPTIANLVISDNGTYTKSHTATLVVQDTGGSYLKAGNYTVRYSWTTSTATPSSYESSTTITVNSNSNTASVNITGSGYTGIRYLHVKVESVVDNAGNALTANTKYVSANFDNTAPRIVSLTIDKDSYEKSHIATLVVRDDDGSLLKEGNYKVKYSWSTSASVPTSYDSETVLAVSAGAIQASTTINGNGYTGIYYLHVLVEGLSDVAGNIMTSNTANVIGKFDNTKPIISIESPSGTKYYDVADTVDIILKVTDLHSKLNSGDSAADFKVDDINVLVAGSALNGNKAMSLTNYDNNTGIGTYKLSLTNVRGTGYVTLNIPSGKIADKAGNENDATAFGINEVKIFIDNTKPVITIDTSDATRKGGIKIESPTSKIDLDDPKDVIDERYINKEYQINIPFVITDVGTDIANNILEPSDIRVYVNGLEVAVDKVEVNEVGRREVKEPTTQVVTYTRKYELVLKGIVGDGYLDIRIDANAVTDLVGNNNDANVYSPYTVYNGSNVRVFVDNTKPVIVIISNSNPIMVTDDTELEFILKITDNGSGITERQFMEEDVIPQIDGINSSASKVLEKDANNNYETALGNGAASNYTYTLRLSEIVENGTLRINIPENAIVDKANNGIASTTLPTEIIIDNVGPTIGKIHTNADEYGRLVDVTTELSIDNCTDPSGIARYEWQVSKDGNNWETVSIDNSSLPSSEATHQIENEGKVYYRVIVSDALGNSTISDVEMVTFMKSINRKPTIRFETVQPDSSKVEINATIKSTSEIVRISVNGNEIEKEKWNSSKINTEITITTSYVAISNGVYEFEVEDSRGNIIKEKVNVNTIEAEGAKIRYEVTNATMTSEAQITFISEEAIKIVDPNRYPGIKFDITESYLTRLTAIITKGTDFSTDKTFTFENTGKIKTDVIVKAPITTEVVYLRFVDSVSTPLDVTANEAKSLTNGIKTSQVTVVGKVKSYYGFDTTNVNANVASKEALEAASVLGNAGKTYVQTQNGKKEELGSTVTIEPVTNTSFVNGNVTGMSNKTSGLLEYSESEASSETTYKTFRTTITK